MIECTIASPLKTEIYTNLQSVVIPVPFGQMQIMSGHAESFAILPKGDIILWQEDKKQQIIPISNGECHIKNNVVTIIL